jgi:hypothetical protein
LCKTKGTHPVHEQTLCWCSNIHKNDGSFTTTTGLRLHVILCPIIYFAFRKEQTLSKIKWLRQAYWNGAQLYSLPIAQRYSVMGLSASAKFHEACTDDH